MNTFIKPKWKLVELFICVPIFVISWPFFMIGLTLMFVSHWICYRSIDRARMEMRIILTDVKEALDPGYKD